MKPIIIDAREMTDSTEVYSTRPHPFFTIFIYVLLAILCVAIGWMFFAKIDMVVTAQGTVTTEDNVSTITNTFAGKIADLKVADGQEVNEGDVLYSIECDDLDAQMNQQRELLSDIQDRLKIANAYLSWLNGKGDVLEDFKDNQYYDEYNARKELVELNYDSASKSTDVEKSQYNTTLKNTQSSIEYYEDKIAKYKQLLSSINNQSNPFSENDAYYYSFIEGYLAQYTATKTQYDNEINNLNDSIGSLKDQKEDVTNQINELRAAIDTSNENIDAASEKITELQGEQQSESDLTSSIEEQEQMIAAEKANIELYNANMEELNENMISIDAEIDTANSQIDTYKNNQNDTLYSLKTDTIASVEQMKKTAEETLTTLQSNLDAAQNNLDHISDDMDQSLTKTNEINTAYSEIASYEEKEKEMRANIEELENNLGEATLKATKSGVVNLLENVETGDYLSAGTEVMTIIPDTEDSGSYSVDLYISNEDIGHLDEGMDVKYEIAAFPSEEYGNITGMIKNISKDTKVSDNNGISIIKPQRRWIVHNFIVNQEKKEI